MLLLLFSWSAFHLEEVYRMRTHPHNLQQALWRGIPLSEDQMDTEARELRFLTSICGCQFATTISLRSWVWSQRWGLTLCVVLLLHKNGGTKEGMHWKSTFTVGFKVQSRSRFMFNHWNVTDFLYAKDFVLLKVKKKTETDVNRFRFHLNISKAYKKYCTNNSHDYSCPLLVCSTLFTVYSIYYSSVDVQ